MDFIWRDYLCLNKVYHVMFSEEASRDVWTSGSLYCVRRDMFICLVRFAIPTLRMVALHSKICFAHDAVLLP